MDNNIIKIDEENLKNDLKGVIRKTIEETLNTMLDEEAAELVPKLRLAPFETAIIERYRRRESSVEESLIEMYLAGVSVRRVEDVTELLWGWKHVR